MPGTLGVTPRYITPPGRNVPGSVSYCWIWELTRNLEASQKTPHSTLLHGLDLSRSVGFWWTMELGWIQETSQEEPL